MAQRGIDWQRQLAELRSNGVQHVVHCPVDMNGRVNHEQVFEAAQRLNDLVKHKQCNVYVQSQSGLTCAPTVVLAYLSLFKRVDNWESLSLTSQLVSQCIDQSQQNEALVERIVDDNLEFLARQYDLETEEALKIRDVWAKEDEDNRVADLKELDQMRHEAHENAQKRQQREAHHRRETDAWKAQRDKEQAAEEARQAQEQADLDDLAERYRREKEKDLAEFERLQAEKNRELEMMRRERDALRRETEDLEN